MTRDISLVRAGLEAAAKVSAHCECAYDIRALDPAAIAAGVPVEPDKRDAELAALRAEVDRLAACKFPDSRSIYVVTLPNGERWACADVVGAEIERLRARVAELEQDAARYRWLRDTPWPPDLISVIQMQQNGKWDAVIDAAMLEGNS